MWLVPWKKQDMPLILPINLIRWNTVKKNAEHLPASRISLSVLAVYKNLRDTHSPLTYCMIPVLWTLNVNIIDANVAYVKQVFSLSWEAHVVG